VNNTNLKAILVGEFSPLRLVRSMLLIVILVYLGISLFVHFYAEKIIFQPQPATYKDTDRIIKLDSGSGAKISAIYLKDPDARYSILFNHGNAEDIETSMPTLESLKSMGFSVFSYDYSGYGTSTGTPSEANSFQDAEAAYNYLANDLKVPAKQIIVLGRSLGGAVATDLAHRKQAGGLVIESSFVSAYRVMTRIPLLPFDKFNTLSKIKNVNCPVLVIHGTNDELIPIWHGERLFQEANEPKLSFWVENATHNNLFSTAGDRYATVLKEFVALIESRY
jgi:fermentation-respiration switch protein FrsA (DUF1100 family)